MSLLKTKNTSSNNKIDKMKQNLINPKNVTPFNILVDSKLHKQFKIKAISNGESMTDIIIQAMENYIRH